MSYGRNHGTVKVGGLGWSADGGEAYCRQGCEKSVLKYLEDHGHGKSVEHRHLHEQHPDT